jgi:NAD(P)H-nitrite reductase large subunit
MKYVIIGNSISGISAIKAIREFDKKGEITVISDEPSPNYSKPLISYLLGRKVTLDKINFCEKNFYKGNKVKLILNKKASKLDLKKKCVVLENKQKIPFDKLLIATGGAPIVPKIKGLDLNGVFTFTNLSDAQKIEKYIKANKVKKALVLGGGLIGLKATEALIDLNIKVAIVELAKRILSSTFDIKTSNIIENALKKIGCNLITNNTIVKIEGNKKKVKGATLEDGRKISSDLVIIAIGVRPNTELTKDTPIKVNKGILVDKFMQTNVKDIYAAGDCCEAMDLLYGKKCPVAIWPVAAREGKIAGYNMAGIKEEYSGSLIMNSVELCGIPTISVGLTNLDEGDVEILEYFDQNENIYKKIVLKNNRIVGFIFVSDIRRAGIYTGLIKDKVNVVTFKQFLLKEDFGLVNLPQKYRKHLVSGEAAII